MNSSSIVPATPSLADFLKNYIYLFFIDIDSLIDHDHTYDSYEMSEPNYAQNMLEAYCEIFSKDSIFSKDTVPSGQHLQKIHHVATQHLPQNGQFKTECNHFAVNGKKGDAARFISVTEQGLREFLLRWFVNSAIPTHMIAIQSKTQADKGFLLEAPLVHGSRTILLRSFENNTSNTEVLTLEKDFMRIYSLLMDSEQYITEINSLLDDVIGDADVELLTKHLLSSLYKSYNEKIAKCKTKKEKISCIVELSQSVDQLHPFLDGNIRSCYIQLNYLLHQNNLSFTILANPNRLDMFGNEELVQLVIEGQELFKNLCKKIIPMYHDQWITRKDFVFNPMPELNANSDLIDKFINKVLLKNYYLTQGFSVTHYDKAIQYDPTYFRKVIPAPRISEQESTQVKWLP